MLESRNEEDRVSDCLFHYDPVFGSSVALGFRDKFSGGEESIQKTTATTTRAITDGPPTKRGRRKGGRGEKKGVGEWGVWEVGGG